MYVLFSVDEAKIEFYIVDSELSTKNKEKCRMLILRDVYRGVCDSTISMLCRFLKFP